MDKMYYEGLKRVEEAVLKEEANRLLAEGWTLLKIAEKDMLLDNISGRVPCYMFGDFGKVGQPPPSKPTPTTQTSTYMWKPTKNTAIQMMDAAGDPGLAVKIKASNGRLADHFGYNYWLNDKQTIMFRTKV